MKDLHSKLSGLLAAGPAVLTTSSTAAAIDLRDYNSAEIFFAVGAGGITFSGTNKIELIVTHSDDDSDYEAVADGDVLGVASVGSGGVVKSITSAHASAALYRLGYVGGKKYIKVQVALGGTHSTGTALAAMVVKGHGADNPQANQI